MMSNADEGLAAPSMSKLLSAETLKLLALVVPVVATGLAIVFDVGYFAAIDIHYYPLFSFSEHVVFAVEALPLLLVMLTLIPSIIMIFKGFVVRTVEKKSSKHGQTIGDAIAYTLATLVFIVGLLTGYSSLVFWIVWMVFVIQNEWVLRGRIAPFFAVGVAVATVWLLGGDWARLTIRDRTKEHVFQIGGAEITGKLLRAGERGLIYARYPDKEVRFTTWEPIKSISTRKPAHGFWLNFKSAIGWD